jgi:hypothetical protein
VIRLTLERYGELENPKDFQLRYVLQPLDEKKKKKFFSFLRRCYFIPIASLHKCDLSWLKFGGGGILAVFFIVLEIRRMCFVC